MILQQLFSQFFSRIVSYLGCSSSQRFTPICDCSVDTELIRLAKNPIQQFHIGGVSVVVNGVFAFSFTHNSTIQ